MWPPMPGSFLFWPMHHGHGVPADQALDAALQHAIAGIRHFFFHGNGIDVRGIELDGDFDARLARALDQSIQQLAAAVDTLIVDHLIKCFKPFGYFFFRCPLPGSPGTPTADALLVWPMYVLCRVLR